MSQTGNANAASASSGFMLIDMVLALAILLLVAAILWPIAFRGTSRSQQAATALDIATLLRNDRTSASRDGRPTGTRIDLAGRTVTAASGRRVTIPSDLSVEVTTATPCIEAPQRFVIMFAPDGSSCGGLVRVSKGADSYAIRINWLSGMIDIVNLPNT